MQIGVWFVYESMNANGALFDPSSELNRDNCLAPYHRLRDYGLQHGVQFDTLPMVDIETCDAFLFIEFPDMSNTLVKQAFATGKPRFLIAHECPVVYLANWDANNQSLFDSIFTWADDYIDGNKFIKCGFTVELPEKPLRLDKTAFCTMINMNKTSGHPLEQYSARIQAIKWFEQNHPEDFDLYGYGWDGRPSYRGVAQNKLDILSKSKFAIVYENATGYPGYITEKIFDCFAAGCVPIYWGANNTTQYIPRDCFIHPLNYDTYEDMYVALKAITNKQYKEYIDCIEDFLQSPKAKLFSTQHFASTICNMIKDKTTVWTNRIGVEMWKNDANKKPDRIEELEAEITNKNAVINSLAADLKLALNENEELKKLMAMNPQRQITMLYHEVQRLKTVNATLKCGGH